MNNFGAPFKKYNALGIAHLSFPDTAEGRQNFASLGVTVPNINALAELRPASTYILSKEPVESNLRVVTSEYLTDNLVKKLLKEVEVGVAPAARVYPISPEQPDLSDMVKKTLPYFNYYVVELGLKVSVGQEARVPNLKFEVDLYSDGDDRTDVTTNSVAPTDNIRTVVAVEGKITIGINKLLQLIPGPIGQVIPNLISIDLNPVSFRWALTKYTIDTSGSLDYKASWRIYGTQTVQSFNPLIVLKARKKISKIFAKVRVIYELKRGILTSQFYSDEKKVSILPM